MSVLYRSLWSALAAVLLLGGCTSGEGSGGAQEDAPAASATSADETEDTAQSVTVEHAMGSTDVTCTPERVVTLGQGQTDSTLALGVTPVGVVEPWTDEFYAYLPEEINDAEVVGSELEPDLETIASLEPDLILGSKLRHQEIYDQVSQIAPTVFAEMIGRTWKDNVDLLARALCREDEGEEILAAWEERTAAFEEELGELADTEVSLIRFKPDQVRIYLTGFPGSVLRDAGLRRPEAQQVDDWENAEQLVEISKERIPDMDGDVIFVMLSDWAEGEAFDVQEEWTSHPLWQQLTAVQNDAVFPINEDTWNLGGGILAAHAMLDDLEEHFLQPGGVREALTGAEGQ